jgi:hypothetical protein
MLDHRGLRGRLPLSVTALEDGNHQLLRWVHPIGPAARETLAEAERVQQDVRLALQIAGEKLALVQRRLQDPTR